MTRIIIAGILSLVLVSCGNNPQPRAYVSELTSDDSLMIRMGKWNLTRYHSEKLGMDINYPSFFYHQELPSEHSQELFVAEDVSISVIVDSLTGMNYSAGQQMMGMGADLVDVGDDYTIHEGEEDKWEYYGKVIESDSLRLITVMLRYYPEHADAVEVLREWVRDFDMK